MIKIIDKANKKYFRTVNRIVISYMQNKMELSAYYDEREVAVNAIHKSLFRLKTQIIY